MIYYNEQCMLSMSRTKEKTKNFGQQGQPIVWNWKEMGTILGNIFFTLTDINSWQIYGFIKGLSIVSKSLLK